MHFIECRLMMFKHNSLQQAIVHGDASKLPCLSLSTVIYLILSLCLTLIPCLSLSLSPSLRIILQIGMSLSLNIFPLYLFLFFSILLMQNPNGLICLSKIRSLILSSCPNMVLYYYVTFLSVLLSLTLSFRNAKCNLPKCLLMKFEYAFCSEESTIGSV